MGQIEQMRILAKRMQDDITATLQDIDRAITEGGRPDFDKLLSFQIAFGRLSRDLERIDRVPFMNRALVDAAGLAFHDAAYSQYEREGFSSRTKIEQAILRGTRVYQYTAREAVAIPQGGWIDVFYEVPVHHYKEDFWELWTCYRKDVDTLMLDGGFG